jgi:hypothetical protein
VGWHHTSVPSIEGLQTTTVPTERGSVWRVLGCVGGHTGP